jgi:HAD superfamily hydrolase (TIGR01509 family)
MINAMALPPFAALILDMDGLVLDSETTYCRAWQQAAAELGHQLDDAFLQNLFGRHADDVVRLLATTLGPDFDRQRFFQTAERHWFEHIQSSGIPQMPGVDALLKVLRERMTPFALATNSDDRYARLCLRLGDLEDVFPVVVTRDQVASGKPEPDVFLEAARRLAIEPEACLVLEDSATGLLAARAAGMQAVLIQRREDLRDKLRPHAFMVLPSLIDFVELWHQAVG